MSLSDIAIKNAKPADKAYKLADGLGMFLLVQANGSRLWRLKYRFAGKEKLLALGRYPDISLKWARERRDAARLLSRRGKTPAPSGSSQGGENAFGPIAREFAQQRSARWSSAHAADVLHRPEKYVFPDLGDRPIAEITPMALLDIIRKIEARGATELAHRMVQPCGQVFRYGIATGRCPRGHCR